jgi:hypothetical protein
MVLASKMTSVVFAAVTALLRAHAIAMETYWMSAEFAAVTVSRTAHAIAMEMYWTSAENAAVTASPMAHAIVKAMAQRLDTIVMMNAWSIRMEMVSATSLR